LYKRINMDSVLDKELISYFVKLDESQKKSLLEMIKSFLKKDSVEIPSATIEAYNQELAEAMERMNKGAFTTLEDLEKEMLSW
jgi:hypothetical protein